MEDQNTAFGMNIAPEPLCGYRTLVVPAGVADKMQIEPFDVNRHNVKIIIAQPLIDPKEALP